MSSSPERVTMDWIAEKGALPGSGIAEWQSVRGQTYKRVKRVGRGWDPPLQKVVKTCKDCSVGIGPRKGGNRYEGNHMVLGNRLRHLKHDLAEKNRRMHKANPIPVLKYEGRQKNLETVTQEKMARIAETRTSVSKNLGPYVRKKN